jgi:hypothetical protein
VEKGYVELGVSSWQRKEVISQIAKEIKIKIFDLPPAGWSKVMAAAIDNLAAKNLMLYLTDNHLESIALANGWGGEIKNVAQDYLMVVDANLGALKTDSVMDRGLSYEVKPGSGGLTGKLTIDYTNHGKADWRTGTYKSYTRVYVPLGSQLIDVSGYKADQIDVGQESGKTWFGFFLTVDPGKTKTLTVDYKLPDLIKATGKYALYLQKQPGKEYSGVKVDLSFLNEIKSYNADYASMIKISPTKIGWNGDLNVDRSFQIELK